MAARTSAFRSTGAEESRSARSFNVPKYCASASTVAPFSVVGTSFVTSLYVEWPKYTRNGSASRFDVPLFFCPTVLCPQGYRVRVPAQLPIHVGQRQRALYATSCDKVSSTVTVSTAHHSYTPGSGLVVPRWRGRFPQRRRSRMTMTVAPESRTTRSNPARRISAAAPCRFPVPQPTKHRHNPSGNCSISLRQQHCTHPLAASQELGLAAHKEQVLSNTFLCFLQHHFDRLGRQGAWPDGSRRVHCGTAKACESNPMLCWRPALTKHPLRSRTGDIPMSSTLLSP